MLGILALPPGISDSLAELQCFEGRPVARSWRTPRCSTALRGAGCTPRCCTTSLVYSSLLYGPPGRWVYSSVRPQVHGPGAARPPRCTPRCCTASPVYSLVYSSLLHGVPGVLLVAPRRPWCTPWCCTASLVYSSLLHGVRGVLLVAPRVYSSVLRSMDAWYAVGI